MIEYTLLRVGNVLTNDSNINNNRHNTCTDDLFLPRFTSTPHLGWTNVITDDLAI